MNIGVYFPTSTVTGWVTPMIHRKPWREFGPLSQRRDTGYKRGHCKQSWVLSLQFWSRIISYSGSSENTPTDTVQQLHDEDRPTDSRFIDYDTGQHANSPRVRPMTYATQVKAFTYLNKTNSIYLSSDIVFFLSLFALRMWTYLHTRYVPCHKRGISVPDNSYLLEEWKLRDVNYLLAFWICTVLQT